MNADIAIVNYGLGNLYSIRQACAHAGLTSTVTADRKIIQDARGIILPGVGAFGHAMTKLADLNLIEPLKNAASENKLLVGICLGMQLLMSRSSEFGNHRGLDIIAGPVERLDASAATAVVEMGGVRIPQVGWNSILSRTSAAPENKPCCEWDGAPLRGLRNGESMYFVHSFCAHPEETAAILSVTSYGPVTFCSSVRKGRVFGFQFHPERSGPAGLQIYKNIASLIRGG